MRLTASGVGVRAVVELTLPAAEHLSTSLRTVTMAAVATADYVEDDGADE